MLCKEAGKSGVDSGIIPFNMKGLLCTTLTDSLSFGVWGEGGSWPPSCIPSKWPCVQEGRIAPRRLRAHGQEDLAETLNAFPYEEETRKLEAAFCLCDQSQGGKTLSRDWPKVLWPPEGFIDLNGKHGLQESLGLCLLQELGAGGLDQVLTDNRRLSF